MFASKARSIGRLQVQLGVLPISPSAPTTCSRTAEVEVSTFIVENLDLTTDEEVLALRAETHLVQVPPLLLRITRLKQPQLPTGRKRDGVQISFWWSLVIGFAHRSLLQLNRGELPRRL